MVPDASEFSQIDKLIGEVMRYAYMEEKYSNEKMPISVKLFVNLKLYEKRSNEL